MPIQFAALTGLGAATGGSSATASAGVAKTTGSGFADQLTKMIDGVEDASAEANDAVTGMIDKTGDVHDAMIALQRAEMTLQLAVQVRNKLVNAYNDIMRMPV